MSLITVSSTWLPQPPFSCLISNPCLYSSAAQCHTPRCARESSPKIRTIISDNFTYLIQAKCALFNYAWDKTQHYITASFILSCFLLHLRLPHACLWQSIRCLFGLTGWERIAGFLLFTSSKFEPFIARPRSFWSLVDLPLHWVSLWSCACIYVKQAESSLNKSAIWSSCIWYRIMTISPPSDIYVYTYGEINHTW